MNIIVYNYIFWFLISISVFAGVVSAGLFLASAYAASRLGKRKRPR